MLKEDFLYYMYEHNSEDHIEKLQIMLPYTSEGFSTIELTNTKTIVMICIIRDIEINIINKHKLLDYILIKIQY